MSGETLLPPARRADGPGPRSARGRGPSFPGTADRLFPYWLLGIASIVLVLAVVLGCELAVNSRLAWARYGLGFLGSTDWDPVAESLGALPFIYGTLLTSALAMLIAFPLGVGSAIFLAELAPRRVSETCAFLIELLAAIPTVILGLMGIFLLVPAVRFVEPALNRWLGWLPLFRGAPYGVGYLAASVMLALIILPYIVSISREVILTVPRTLKEACLALGATHWEMVRMVVLPYARSGIFGSAFLALGRALGETMAVTMVIGNRPQISASLLQPGYTMAAVIANEFAEATSDLYRHALIAVGFSLFGITILVNALARLMIHRLELRSGVAG